MNRPTVDPIANAVLYEGYILYPYRPSVKNRQRWTFGGLYPGAYCRSRGGSDAPANQTESLVEGTSPTSLEVAVRFLHLSSRTAAEITPPLADWPDGAEPPSRPVEMLRVGAERYYTWQEAEEREVGLGEVTLGELSARPQIRPFSFPGGRRSEPVRGEGGQVVGVLIRERQAVEGVVELSAAEVGEGLYRLTLRVANRSAWGEDESGSRDDALMRALVSTHAVLGVRRGEFVSLLDPPGHLAQAAAACRNVGTWPVLVGEEGQRDTILSSPIILYDYPRVAPESQGDFFDGAEIDEMLTLRVLTMTDEEKTEMAAIDERTKAILERVEALSPEQMLALHGTVRGLRAVPGGATVDNWDPEPAQRRVESVQIGPAEVRQGDRVRLAPNRRADIMDLVLAGMTATVESIEQDYEGRVYLAVTVDDDPGKDLGTLRQPGHRFFFQPDEVEPLP